MPMQHIQMLRGERDNETVQLVESSPLPPWGKTAEFDVVGQPVPRVEGMAKVTGRACYASDVRLPGQLYAHVLRSPYPHARIRHIDTSRAEAVRGVHAVLCHANAPQLTWYGNSLLFDTTVRFVGDEVAAVAAESEDIARDAVRLIGVVYDPGSAP